MHRLDLRLGDAPRDRVVMNAIANKQLRNQKKPLQFLRLQRFNHLPQLQTGLCA